MKWAVLGIVALGGLGVMSYYASRRAMADVQKMLDAQRGPRAQAFQGLGSRWK